MASLRTSVVQTALRESRKPYVCPRCELRRIGYSVVNPSQRRQQFRYSSTSTESPAPPLLSKLKGDLKSAMRAKDTPRLNVLRALISEFNNASKTNSPIKTDLQLLALLKRRKSASENAAAEAKKANRDDLEQKQLDEIKIMDQYAQEVSVMTEDEIKEAIHKVLQEIQQGTSEKAKNMGDVVRKLFESGGLLDGKPADRGQVVKIVKDFLDGK